MVRVVPHLPPPVWPDDEEAPPPPSVPGSTSGAPCDQLYWRLSGHAAVRPSYPPSRPPVLPHGAGRRKSTVRDTCTSSGYARVLMWGGTTACAGAAMFSSDGGSSGSTTCKSTSRGIVAGSKLHAVSLKIPMCAAARQRVQAPNPRRGSTHRFRRGETPGVRRYPLDLQLRLHTQSAEGRMHAPRPWPEQQPKERGLQHPVPEHHVLVLRLREIDQERSLSAGGRGHPPGRWQPPPW
jgi:hypothetical protein